MWLAATAVTRLAASAQLTPVAVMPVAWSLPGPPKPTAAQLRAVGVELGGAARVVEVVPPPGALVVEVVAVPGLVVVGATVVEEAGTVVDGFGLVLVVVTFFAVVPVPTVAAGSAATVVAELSGAASSDPLEQPAASATDTPTINQTRRTTLLPHIRYRSGHRTKATTDSGRGAPAPALRPERGRPRGPP